jgi:hypothetical protein
MNSMQNLEAIWSISRLADKSRLRGQSTFKTRTQNPPGNPLDSR